MEFKKFLNILKKHRYGILIIPILVMMITYFLVKDMPDTYTSKARLSAGITEKSTQLLQNGENAQETQINQNFSNLLQTLQLKVVSDQLSYQLIIHDLSSAEPFRKPSKLVKYLNSSARAHAIQVYSKFYTERKSLSLYDKDQYGLDQVIKSMGYDYESLSKKMKTYRVGNSDFIDIEFESENPTLSAFIVNTYSRECINYYAYFVGENERKSINYLGEILRRKKDSLDRNTENLKNYKIQNGVLNLNDQAKTLYGQIADFETKLRNAEKEVESNTGAIKDIDAKFTDNEKQYSESRAAAINRDIVKDEEQLNYLNEQYIKSGFDSSIMAKRDLLKKSLTRRINLASDRYISNPLSSKDALISQKLKMQVDLGLAKSSIPALKQAIENLNKKLAGMVPNEAVIQAFEGQISVESQEYIELLKKYNTSSMDISNTGQIKLIEMGLPGPKQSSKKMVIVIVAGVVCAILYILILFILYYVDKSIKIANDLTNKTEIRVLGYLPIIKTSVLDIQNLWNMDSANPQTAVNEQATGKRPKKMNAAQTAKASNTEFKKQLRSTRFEINMALNGARNLVITSLVKGEGKTLLALSMVSAYQMTNKKVLLIDGNFMNNGITQMAQPRYFIEDYLNGMTTIEEIADRNNISVLGNKGTDLSLFEICDRGEIEQKLLVLKDYFDLIIIEAAPMNTLNIAKEWIVVADRMLCVFEANTNITFEKNEEIEYFKTLNGKFIGWVLNKVSDHNI